MAERITMTDMAELETESAARLESLQRIARAVGVEGSLLVAEQVERRITKLEAVATEAAAMLAETDHGGLSHVRRVSMRNALEVAGVPIPAQCSACPHEEPKPYCECGAPSCEVCHP